MSPNFPSLESVLPRGGTLHLVYQPRVMLGNMKSHMVEALLRWVHPFTATVAADAFIGAAERTGDIVEMGQWALDQALSQVARWQAQGYSMAVAVNVSPLQVDDVRFARDVQRALARHGVAPSLLELELTEASTVEDEGRAGAVLGQLRDMGVGLAVDDFGKGAAGVSMLRWMPAQVVKLDKSLVDCLGPTTAVDSTGGKRLVQALVEFVHRLGAVSVAEGVETREQVQVLRAMGCDQAQGYYFSLPIEGSEAHRYDVPPAERLGCNQ